MVWYEIACGSPLVGVLIALSFYFGRQQWVALRQLRQNPALPDEEMHYERRKAYRRLVSCVLTLVLAALLVVLLVYGVQVQPIADERDAFAPGQAPPIPAEQKPLLRIWGWSLIAFLLVLLLVMVLAAVDLLATRRYGLRQFRKLQADRRAMIERQANRMRRERNGQG